MHVPHRFNREALVTEPELGAVRMRKEKHADESNRLIRQNADGPCVDEFLWRANTLEVPGYPGDRAIQFAVGQPVAA